MAPQEWKITLHTSHQGHPTILFRVFRQEIALLVTGTHGTGHHTCNLYHSLITAEVCLKESKTGYKRTLLETPQVELKSNLPFTLLRHADIGLDDSGRLPPLFIPDLAQKSPYVSAKTQRHQSYLLCTDLMTGSAEDNCT